MSPVKVPANLPDLVKTRFGRAKARGDLTHFPSLVTVLTVDSCPFQVRFSPALASKPKAPKRESPSAEPPNPFENPPPGLVVAPLPPAHVLVLNKFAVVPEHFLLITKEFRPQTHLLESDDLAAAYACIGAFDHGDAAARGGGLFVFFNSGPHSGASQPHRHLQLLPINAMMDGLETCEGGQRWRVLADRLVGDAAAELPFATFGEELRPSMDAASLRAAYLSLYRAACRATGDDLTDDEALGGEARISYNMAMTRDAMVLCPRLNEGSAIHGPDGTEVGQLALNGTVLAGTALVKSQAEWNALRSTPGLLRHVLGRIGVAT